MVLKRTPPPQPMTALQLVERLQAVVAKHGDLPVKFFDGDGDVTVREVCAYDTYGGLPKKGSPAMEIYLHGGG